MKDKNNSLGTDALKLTISKAIVLVISLVSGMLLSRFRTLEEYGTYSQLMMVVTLGTTIIMMGLPNSLNFFLARAENGNERTDFLSTYYSLSTILSLIVGVVLVMITPILVHLFNNPLITGFIYFLALYPWTKIICSSIENVLIVYKKSNWMMLYRILNSILLLVIIVFVQVMKWSFNIYMILYLTVEGCFSGAIYFLVKKLAPKLHFTISKVLVKKIFAFSVPIGLASMVGTLNIELDKLVVGALMNTEELAIYTNASKEMPVTIIATSITAVLMPQMVRLLKNQERTKAVELWGAATVISFSVLSFLALALVVFAHEVITFLYSAKYLPGVPIFCIYSLGLMLRSTYYGMVLNASGKTKFIFYSSIASLILNIILNFALFYAWGVIVPAIATLISSIVIQTAQLIATSKIMNIKFRYIFPWSQLLKILIINVIMAVIFYFIKLTLPMERFIGDLGEAIIIGVVWTAIIFLVFKKNIKKNWLKLNAE